MDDSTPKPQATKSCTMRHRAHATSPCPECGYLLDREEARRILGHYPDEPCPSASAEVPGDVAGLIQSLRQRNRIIEGDDTSVAGSPCRIYEHEIDALVAALRSQRASVPAQPKPTRDEIAACLKAAMGEHHFRSARENLRYLAEAILARFFGGT